jgi:hypothetical protein
VAVQLTGADLGLDCRGAAEVGYRAPYAAYVDAKVPFLQSVAAHMLPELEATAQAAVDDGATCREAMLEAADALFEASQSVCPVRTGKLKASGYVRMRRAQKG